MISHVLIHPSVELCSLWLCHYDLLEHACAQASLNSIADVEANCPGVVTGVRSVLSLFFGVILALAVILFSFALMAAILVSDGVHSEWFRWYKTPDDKPLNGFGFDVRTQIVV